MSKIMHYARHVTRPRSWYRLFSHLADAPRRRRIADQLVQQKAQRSGQHYNTAPRVAAIVQFFNKKANIPMLWRGLKAAEFDEIIVMDDGSVDGASAEWQSLLTEPNHFLFRSNDLFEIITYDRAIRHSPAEIVCLLQDDDKLPADGKWVKRALELFDTYPDLMILGGFHAVEVLPRTEGDIAEKMEWEIEGDIEFVRNLFVHRTSRFPRKDPSPGLPDFYYAMSAVRAPVFIRRQAYLDMGGFDLSFAPFLCDDMDNGIRAWQAGYKVGVYDVDFQRDIGLGGMRAFNNKRMEVQVRKNWEKLYRKHFDIIKNGELTAMVEKANAELRATQNAK